MNTSQTPKVSRRQLLKGMAYAGAGSLLAACASPAPAPAPEPTAAPTAAAAPTVAQPATAAPTATPPPVAAGKVKIVTPGWPFGIMPTADEQKSDPALKGYADALDAWLQKHPGVTLELSNVNVWSQQDLTTALAGGTAPTFFPGNVLGGWGDAAVRRAFAQGLAADVTDLMKQYEVEQKLIPAAIANYNMFYKTADQKWYGLPESFSAGNGVYYRRDLLAAAGLPEPDAKSWTWDDFRKMSKAMTTDKVKGAVMQQWGWGFMTTSYGGDFFSHPPSPDTKWRYRANFAAPPIVESMKDYRAMAFEDKSILSDATYGDGEVFQAFLRGDAAMMPNNADWFVRSGEADVPALEKLTGKDRSEVLAWMPHPRGPKGAFGATQSFVMFASFDLNAKPDTLAAAFDLFYYFYFGDGFKLRAAATYEATKDLRRVYTTVTPINGVTKIEGVPGEMKDAWPQHYLDAVAAAMTLPIPPAGSQYLGQEANPGPNEQAWGDATAKLAFDETATDIEGELKNASEVVNKQLNDFPSSISREDFVKGSLAYYKDLNAYFEKHMPEFSQDVWKPFYEAEIAPALK